MIEIDKQKLDKLMAERGFSNYREIGEEAKRLGLPLSWRTLYSMVDGGNWRRDSLESLCVILRCKPQDIVKGWGEGTRRYTHAAPRPAQELESSIV